MNDDVKQTIRQARERKNNFSVEQMKNNLTEQFTSMIAHDVTNESIMRIRRTSIEKDISISKAIAIEVQSQVEERVKREQARFIQSAKMVLKSLEPIARENEAMKTKLNLVFWIGVKNNNIPNDAFAQAEVILEENEILQTLLSIAPNVQNITVKMGKSLYKTKEEQ